MIFRIINWMREEDRKDEKEREEKMQKEINELLDPIFNGLERLQEKLRI